MAAIFAVGIVVIGASLATGYWWAKHAGPAATMPDAAGPAQSNVLYWYDPMVPSQHFDKPGKSPFMDMQLVPKYADASGESAGIRVDASTRQNLGIRVAPVERRAFNAALSVVGTIGFNEREVAVVQARTNGFVSRVYGRAPGDVITRGAPLVDVLVPEWAGAQQELIALRHSNDAALLAAVRDRLTLLGMPAEIVRRVERTGAVQTTATIAAPLDGVIQTLDVRQGMTIETGMTIAQINAVRTVWLTAAVPDVLGASIKEGDALTADIPGRAALQGRVIAILPQTDAATRTLSVRAELPNPDGRLRPGQFAQVHLQAAASGDVVSIPSEALIRTGTRTVAIVDDGDRFIPTPVTPGRESDGMTEIRAGLRDDQQVVVSGQFLIDSEANLTGAFAQMGSAELPEKTTPPIKNAELFETSGTVVAIDGATITLSHQPVPALGWGPMTMPFAVASPQLVDAIRVGDQVVFGFQKKGDQFVIERLQKQTSKSSHDAMQHDETLPKRGGGQ
jgi:Cu(I)/Ag(I) efflux system membrane fusion protein